MRTVFGIFRIEKVPDLHGRLRASGWKIYWQLIEARWRMRPMILLIPAA
jgi:hypothetical protein